MTFTLKAAVSALALITVSTPALAQQPRDLDRMASDVRIFNGEVTANPANFAVTIPAGTALLIEARPKVGSNLDPFLRVRDAVTNEVLVEDDDSAGELGGRGLIFAEQERRIEIEVTGEGATEGGNGRGTFELSLRPTDWRPTPARAIGKEERVTGTLMTQEQHVFYVEAAAGDVLNVTLRPTGSGVDPTLELRRGRSATGELIAEDDDSAGNLGARIVRGIDRAGSYTIVARNIGGATGGYSLGLGSGNAGTGLPEAKTIALGIVESGDLNAAADAGDFTGRVVYKLDNAAKAALRSRPGAITVRFRKLDDESGFDPIMDVGFDTPLGFTTLMTDDDSGGELDAAVTIDLSAAASKPEWLDALRFVGRSVSEGEGGLYTIEVVKIGSR